MSGGQDEAAEFIDTSKPPREIGRRESSIESSIRDYCLKRRWYCLKLGGPVGWPDRVVLIPGGRVVIIELKTSDGVVSPLQQLWVDRLMALGFTAGVVRSLDEFKELTKS